MIAIAQPPELSSPVGEVWMGVPWFVGVADGDSAGVALGVRLLVGLGVADWLAVGVGVGVRVAFGVGVGVRVTFGVGVGFGVAFGVGAGVGELEWAPDT